MARKAKRRRGAPYKLTPEIQKKLCEALLAGNYVQVACAYAGIPTSSFYYWLERGENGQKEFVGFLSAVRDAMAQGEMRLVLSVDKNASGRKAQFDEKGRLTQEAILPDWRAAAWMLERKFPDRWGKREKVFEAEKGEDIRPDGSYEKMLEIVKEIEEKDRE